MRKVDRSVKSIALWVENVRPSEDGRDRSVESRNLISAYLLGDRVVAMCI